MPIMLFLILILIFVILLVVVTNIVIVPQSMVYVVERLGSYSELTFPLSRSSPAITSPCRSIRWCSSR